MITAPRLPAVDILERTLTCMASTCSLSRGAIVHRARDRRERLAARSIHTSSPCATGTGRASSDASQLTSGSLPMKRRRGRSASPDAVGASRSQSVMALNRPLSKA